MSYRTEKTHAGMDYLTETACELIYETRDCETKEEVVKDLYGFYQDAKQTEDMIAYQFTDPSHREKMIKWFQSFYEEDREASEKRYEKTKKNHTVDKSYLEDYLLVAVYAEKKLTWEEIKYTHEHHFLPEEKRKQPFPLEEMKQELAKKGYKLTEESENKKEMTM